MKRPEIEKMKVCCHLLDPPAPSVVTELCDYILFLESGGFDDQQTETTYYNDQGHVVNYDQRHKTEGDD